MLDGNIIAMFLNNLLNRRRQFLIYPTRDLVESVDTGMIFSLTKHEDNTLPIEAFLVLLQCLLDEFITISIITTIETVESF